MKNNNYNITQLQLWGLILIAYAFSFAVRIIWVYQFQDNPNFYWNNQLMINTNDGYTWAAGAQNILYGIHEHNPGIRNMWGNATIFFTVLLVKITPFSLETVILYMPTVISSLVVVPIILIARLYGQVTWGFFAALLGSIAWSYYNRTMTGYYDTDMFSAMAPMFILYFLMKSTIDFNLKSALYAAIAIAIYPFLYDAGASIVYAMGIIYAAYLIFYHRKETNTYYSLILVFFALLHLPISAPFNYIATIIILIVLYMYFQKTTIAQKKLIIAAAILLMLFMYFGNVFGLIVGKVMSYITTGTSVEGLHFYGVHQTIREAGKIPFQTFANRISGSELGVILSLVGYIVLVLKHRTFILALPLVGIGAFALAGGLRFTVYAVPIAAMSATYFFYYLDSRLKESLIKGLVLVFGAFWFFITSFLEAIQHYIIPKQRGFFDSLNLVIDQIGITIKQDYLAFFDKNIIHFGGKIDIYEIIIFLIMLLVAMVITFFTTSKKKPFPSIVFISFLTFIIVVPNIAHIIKYKVPTVLNKAEVQDLEKLKSISSSKDYTLTWWDYGYPIWFYSNTNTIIDGGKHQNDNFIISKIMQTSSPELAARLSRVAVETYVDSNYSVIADTLFKNGKKDQVNPNILLAELENGTYPLPKKTRDIYLYLPYRMLNIFPTVSVFGNLDLMTGKALRKIVFYPTVAISNQKGILRFQNGIIFNSKTGRLKLGQMEGDVKYFIATQNTNDNKIQLQSQLYHVDGKYAVVYMKSYNRFIVMDIETFKSTYVQMFILGKYDKELYELVVTSPYTRIYRLKI